MGALALVLLTLLLLFVGVALFLTRVKDNTLLDRFPPTGTVTPVAGGSIHWSKSGSGPAVVLIHGLAGNKHNFAALEKALALNYTVYSLDRPGSGHSRRNASTDASFSYQAAMILEWMDKIAIESAIVVGHSMGGAIALNLAIQQPSRAIALGLICPLTAPLKIKPTLITKLFFRSNWLRRLFSKILLPFVAKRLSARQLPTLFYPEPVNPDFARTYGGAFTLHSEAFLAATDDLAGAQRSLFQQIQRYPDIQCPVGVIYGKEDRILSAKLHTNTITQSIAHAQTLMLDGCGHMIPVTQPQQVAQFITEVVSPCLVDSRCD